MSFFSNLINPLSWSLGSEKFKITIFADREVDFVGLSFSTENEIPTEDTRFYAYNYGDGTTIIYPPEDNFAYGHDYGSTFQEDKTLTVYSLPFNKDTYKVFYGANIKVDPIEHDIELFPNLRVIELQGTQFGGAGRDAAAYGTVSPEFWTDEITEFYFNSTQEITAQIGDMPDSMEILSGRLISLGTVDNGVPNSLIHFNARYSGITGTFNGSNWPTQLEALNIPGNKCSLDYKEIGQSLNNVLTRFSMGTKEVDENSGSWRDIIFGYYNTLDTITRIDNSGNTKVNHDLNSPYDSNNDDSYAGVSDGDPILNSNLKFIRNNIFTGTIPQDFSSCSNLRLYDFLTRQKNSNVSNGSTPGLKSFYYTGEVDNAIDSIHANRDTLNSGDTCNFSIRMRVVGNSTQDVIGTMCNVTRSAIDKVVGTGNYHSTTSGSGNNEGIIDAGHTVDIDCTFNYPIEDIVGNTVYISGDQTSFDNAYGNTSNNADIFQYTQDRFISGNEVRLVDNSSNTGLYTISSATYNSGDDRTEITMNESLDDTNNDGNLVGGFEFDNLLKATA